MSSVVSHVVLASEAVTTTTEFHGRTSCCPQGALRGPGARVVTRTGSLASALVVVEADAGRGWLRSDVVPRAGASGSVLGTSDTEATQY